MIEWNILELDETMLVLARYLDGGTELRVELFRDGNMTTCLCGKKVAWDFIYNHLVANSEEHEIIMLMAGEGPRDNFVSQDF